MFDLFSNLALGFTVALSPENLMLCLIGTFVGTAIGVLPGLGPVTTIAVLLPITFGLPPVGALIMLAGIYYGAQYGGSTTAILVNLPGEAASVVTALDGHQMALQGRAGVALATAAIGSFVAGCVATVFVAVAAKPLISLALFFGPAEYFSLVMLGLVFTVSLVRGPVLNAAMMAVFGLLLSTIGLDLVTATPRLTFGLDRLEDGLNFVPIAVGIFGLAEIVKNLELGVHAQRAQAKVTSMMPTREDIRQASPAIARGTILGSILGVLPAGGAIIASFAAYAMEVKVSKDPSKFGKGAIEGLAAPESANNAAAQTSFIPLLTLGIPPNVVMAMMVGAMIIQGIVPGPQVMTRQPDLFWGLIASMWIGNLMLVIINLPLIRLWVQLLKVPYRMLFPAILIFSCVGVYSINGNPFDVIIIAVFFVIGYWMIKHRYEAAPMIIGIILGPMLEENLRRAIMISRGDLTVFVTRPISALLLAICAAMIFLMVRQKARERADVMFEE